MSRRNARKIGYGALLGAGLALAAGGAAAARDGVQKGQTIARAHDAARGIVSLGGDLCAVGPATRLIDEEGNPVTLADLKSSGSPARFVLRRSGPRSCVLELLQLVEGLPD
jgi:hypothetical protein